MTVASRVQSHKTKGPSRQGRFPSRQSMAPSWARSLRLMDSSKISLRAHVLLFFYPIFSDDPERKKNYGHLCVQMQGTQALRTRVRFFHASLKPESHPRTERSFFWHAQYIRLYLWWLFPENLWSLLWFLGRRLPKSSLCLLGVQVFWYLPWLCAPHQTSGSETGGASVLQVLAPSIELSLPS